MPQTAHFAALGLAPGATLEQVKEAFRTLSKQHHPDLCPPEQRAQAESRFKEIAAAYQTLLKREAGCAVPPPGSPPNPQYAAAYWASHDMAASAPQSFGRYAGHHTEFEYYRSWFRGGAKNSSVLLSMATLLGVPIVAFMVTSLQGESELMKRVKEDGLDAFKSTWEVNGMKTPVNPYEPQHAQDSYMFKYEKYAHLREKKKVWAVPKTAAEKAAEAQAAASGSEGSS